MTTSPAGTPPFSSANSYLTDQTTSANIAALKGDICVYLTKTGAAPKGKRWRMPTAAEFAATIQNEYQRIPDTGSFTAISGPHNVAGTTLINRGYRKVTSNQPYFPASGVRHSTPNSGSLDYVGTGGYYWSSSVYDANTSRSILMESGIVAEDNSNNRWCAMPVRCVVE